MSILSPATDFADIGRGNGVFLRDAGILEEFKDIFGCPAIESKINQVEEGVDEAALSEVTEVEEVIVNVVFVISENGFDIWYVAGDIRGHDDDIFGFYAIMKLFQDIIVEYLYFAKAGRC